MHLVQRRAWNLSLIRVIAVGFVAACGGLDPIVSGDAGVDATVDSSDDASNLDSSPSMDASDGTTPSDGGADVQAFDGSDGSDAASPFACGKTVCDAKTHYCEHKTAGDSGADAGVDTCIVYPPNCLDGGQATCACITGTCACTQNGNQITITCP